MTNPVMFFILVIGITHTYAKNIEINIDSDDLLNLIKVLLSSGTFKNVVDKVIQKRAVQTVYKNPYHPEDDVVEIDMKRQNEKRKEHNTVKGNPVVLETFLEKENDNFIALKEDKSEDVLTDNDQIGTEQSQMTTKIKLSRNIEVFSAPTEKNVYKDVTKNDKYNYTPLQRRYVLKGSFK